MQAEQIKKHIRLFLEASGMTTYALLVLYSERNVRMYMEYLIMVTALLYSAMIVTYLSDNYSISITRKRGY